ncbi:MAG: hypothetical protein K9L70_07235 [Thiohalocapsa sp.]|nr:hypothetical protein [Thiohalocapsa sp.]
MSVTPPTEPDRIRPIVDAWAAEQSGTLQPAEQDALDTQTPHWRAQATQLIAEGLLAYIAVEMVAPDLAIARAHDRHDADDNELAARLGAHLRDFVDYRGELGRLVAVPVTDHAPGDDAPAPEQPVSSESREPRPAPGQAPQHDD